MNKTVIILSRVPWKNTEGISKAGTSQILDEQIKVGYRKRRVEGVERRGIVHKDRGNREHGSFRYLQAVIESGL